MFIIKKPNIQKSKHLEVGGQEINYILKTVSRARRLRLAVYPDGRVVLTKPRFVSELSAEKMVKEKADWVLSRLADFREKGFVSREDGAKKYLKYKAEAYDLVSRRLKYFNQHYQFAYNKISIRNQSSRWGSCTSKKNLNFNYRIYFLPPDLADYIIVHELCHLKEMNHSARFWQLVAKVIPDFLAKRRELKKKGVSFY